MNNGVKIRAYLLLDYGLNLISTVNLEKDD